MQEPKISRTPSVLHLNELSQEGLFDLADGRTAAIWIREFIDSDVANRLAGWFVEHPLRENYKYSDSSGRLTKSDTDRIGIPLSSLYSSLMGNGHGVPRIPEHKTYDDNGLREDIRRQCAPFPAPIDTLRLLLDELWPFGSTIARFAAIRPYVGLARIVGPSETAVAELPEPHMDWLPPSISETDFQCSAVVYLQTTEHGGELDIWHVADDLRKSILDGDIPMRRKYLGAPETLKPTAGDLIVINTRLPHAVRAPQGGCRVAQTCFFGGLRQGQISVWS